VRASSLFALLLVACQGAEDTGPIVDTDSDVAVDTDTGDAMPANPAPFTITVAGDAELTLLFDTPTCTFMGSNFRAFWRNAAQEHAFVLIAETLGHFTEPGTIDQTQSNTRAKLQEEQNGQGIGPFQTDAALGDTFALHVDHLDMEPYLEVQRAWGSFDVGGMHTTDGLGAITVSPTNLPIWCPAVNE
jgi:hypothetical protein